jgi:hypothetical protein
MLDDSNNINYNTQEYNNIDHKKKDIIQRYKENNKLVLPKLEKKELLCKTCDIDLIICEDNPNLLVCHVCGYSEQSINVDVPLSYKESQDYEYKTKYTYDKHSHFVDWLNRLTSNDKKEIPEELIAKLMIEINKEQITDLNSLNEKRIKKYLKKINMTSYYDNTITIINRINGRKTFKLDTEIQNKLCEMFEKIRDPFERHKPKSRKNFFSYSFIITQFFKILGLEEFTAYLPKLKSQDKIREQDEIFEKIVKELSQKDKSIKWKFFSSV